MALAVSSSAFAIDIESYSGSSSVTPAGVPIFASGSDNQPLQKYNQNGSVNNYVWLDQRNKVLSRDLIYSPRNNLIGKRVKLCKVNRNRMNCSNQLRVTSANASPQSRMSPMARSITPFETFWNYSSQFSDDILLTSSSTINTITNFTFTGLGNSGPRPTGLIPRITDQNGTSLVSLFVPINEGYSDFTITNSAQVFLGTTQVINFCPDLLVTDTFPPVITNDSKCVSRMLRDGDLETDNSTYFYPPSPAQFNALFPSVTFKQTETVTSGSQTKTFVSGPRIDNSGNNLLEKYCSSIGNNIVPLDQNEMEVFANSSEFTPGNFWPTTTGYWTNVDDTTHPWSFIPGGMGVVGGLTLPSGNAEFESGSNSYYRGYFMCKKA
ncbi:hypothetical protein [Vibrio sinaloensis]|uniref:hypothetical protein n=1 Tax=Photobacterium sp. (strain ATCC 43367) TaxID=379097 RepID=UPI0022AEE127|nr:hypothetical protein [Vibrio sinaloensis]MCZ4294422.1 hypothetical protein [Vibrio sinaloensis]